MANIDIVALTKTYIADLTTRPHRPALERLALCDDTHGTYSVITVGPLEFTKAEVCEQLLEASKGA